MEIPGSNPNLSMGKKNFWVIKRRSQIWKSGLYLLLMSIFYKKKTQKQLYLKSHSDLYRFFDILTRNYKTNTVFCGYISSFLSFHNIWFFGVKRADYLHGNRLFFFQLSGQAIPLTG